MISTVDPEARHGHKARNRQFDRYKSRLSMDSELIDDVVVTAANVHDAEVVVVVSDGSVRTISPSIWMPRGRLSGGSPCDDPCRGRWQWSSRFRRLLHGVPAAR